MASYQKKGETYISTLQCGAGMDAYLQIELSKDKVEKIEYVKLEPMKKSLSEGIEVDNLKIAVEKGIKKACKTTGKRFHVKKIGYIPNDSRHYDLHGRIAYQILKRIYAGGKFNE